MSNDVTFRALFWRRLDGDAWDAFDALPPAIRRRLREHAYDPWAVNALVLWRLIRRRTGCPRRAERRLLWHIRDCEARELATFAAAWRAGHGTAYPHLAAGASVLRYAPAAGGRVSQRAGMSAPAAAGPPPGRRGQGPEVPRSRAREPELRRGV